MKKKKMPIYLIGAICIALIGILVILTCIIATGSVHLRKHEIVICTSGAEKQYDGTPLRCFEYHVKSGHLTKDHRMEVSLTGERTEVGVTKNTAEVHIYDQGGMEVTNQYAIRIEEGDLEVTRKKLLFESESAKLAFHAQSAGYPQAYLKNGQVAYDEKIEFDGFFVAENPGIFPNTFHASVKNRNGEDVSEQYEIEYSFGELTLYYDELCFESGSSEKTYDGTPLTNTECRLASGKLQPGHRYTAVTSGAITRTGSCVNSIDVVILDNHDNDVSDLYNITKNAGILTVVPRNLVIKTKDIHRTIFQDPEEDDWFIMAGSLAPGEILEVTTYQQASTVTYGTFENSVQHISISNPSNNWSNTTICYQIEYVQGTFTITE